jgi:hypothetical protein
MIANAAIRAFGHHRPSAVPLLRAAIIKLIVNWDTGIYGAIVGICLLISNPLYYQYLKRATVNGPFVGGPEGEKRAGRAGRFLTLRKGA